MCYRAVGEYSPAIFNPPITYGGSGFAETRLDILTTFSGCLYETNVSPPVEIGAISWNATVYKPALTQVNAFTYDEAGRAQLINDGTDVKDRDIDVNVI